MASPGDGATTNLTDIFAMATLPPDVDCKHVTFIIYVIILGPLVLIGIVGNIVTVLVLGRDKQNHGSTFLLQSMTVFDSCFLAVAGTSLIFNTLVVFFEIEHPFQPYNIVLIWPLVHVTQSAAVWITVLVAVNRCIVICLPYRVNSYCSERKSKLQVAIMLALVTIYNIPRFMEYKIIHVTEPETNSTTIVEYMTDMALDPSYREIYQKWTYFIFIFLGPFVILLVCSVLLVRALWRRRKRFIGQNLPVYGEEDDQNLTRITVVIISLFAVLQFPALLNNILMDLIEKAYVCHSPAYYYYHISNLLVCANSLANFGTYYFWRKQFRNRLWAFCTRRQVADPQGDSHPPTEYRGRASTSSANSTEALL